VVAKMALRTAEVVCAQFKFPNIKNPLPSKNRKKSNFNSTMPKFGKGVLEKLVYPLLNNLESGFMDFHFFSNPLYCHGMSHLISYIKVDAHKTLCVS
jgi:hypothetical protein